MALTREDVVWAYRIFLAREPESEDVIISQINELRSRKQLIAHIIESEEFASKHIVR